MNSGLIRIFTVLLTCCLFAGCGGGNSEYSVQGEVTFQKQPVLEGEIVMADASGTGKSAHAKIVNGRYELRATAGEKTVRITARKETGKTIEGGMGVKVAETIDLIPAKYNTNSTLKYSVLPAGQNKADFSLE